MPTKYRKYTEVPGNVPPDVPLWLNAALAEIDADMEAVAKALPVKCVRREAGAWVWDRTGAATHYLITDHTGAYVVRASPQPLPDATPSLTW